MTLFPCSIEGVRIELLHLTESVSRAFAVVFHNQDSLR